MERVYGVPHMFMNGLTKRKFNYRQWVFEYTNQVAEILKVCYRDALLIVESNAKQRMPMASLLQQCTVIKALDIPPFTLPELFRSLKLRTYELEHRYWLLHDLGVKNITLYDLGHLNRLMLLPGIKFKAHFQMNSDENLVENIFNNIGEYPKNMPSLEKYQNSMSVENVYSHYLLCYKMWKTGIFWSRYRTYYNRPQKNLQYLSFRLIKETEHMLRTEFNVMGQIRKQMYPFFISTPTNIKVLLSKLPEFDLGDKSLKDIIKRNPRLLLSDPYNVYSVCKVLEENNVPVEPAIELYRNAEIFILDSQIVRERLHEFTEDPFLQLWCEHRSVVNMILHHETVWRNLYILRATSSIPNSTVTTMTLSYKDMYRFFKRNCSVYAGKYVRFLLQKELSLKDNKIFYYLQRHTRWYLLTAMHISEVLRFLKTLFPKEAICENIHIIMYTRSDVSDTLNQIREACDIESYTYSHQLALCVYLLEKQKRPIMNSRPRMADSIKRTLKKPEKNVTDRIENILDSIIFSGNPEA